MHGFYTEINANNKQITLFKQHCGTGRHAYNWGLALCIEKLLKKEKIPSAIDLHKLLVKEVKKVNKWYYESSKCSPQQALRNLETAFKRFWKQEHPKNLKKPFKERYHKKFLKQQKKGEIKKLSFIHEKGFPSFKKKNINDSFYLEGKIESDRNMIKVPKIGWIKIYEHLPESTYKNCTISRHADKWFISFKVQDDKKIELAEKRTRAGADIGIKKLCTLSDGTTFDNPKAYNRFKKKLATLQRKLSRQYEACKDNKDADGHIIYSENYKKTKNEIARLHLKISNIRKDATHKLTTHLVKNHDEIVIEDLNVSGMLKNHNLAGAIADGGFFEFKRQLEYKCKWYGSELIIADRWFASSKICSCCGHKKEKMTLRERIFNCEKCGLSIDRDLNAAINLKNYAVSDTVKACGDSKFHLEAIQEVGIGEAGIRPQNGNVPFCVSS